MDITKAIFVEGSPQKSIWFKNIIEEFYIKNYGRLLTVNELRELNREVIAYMVENLKSIQKQVSRPTVQQKVVYQEPQTEYSRNTNIGRVDDLFNKRQKDYETLFQKPSPPEMNFSENAKDEPISNMEELIKAQQKQREYDLQMSLAQAQAQAPAHPKVTIHGQENILVPIDGIIDNESKKKVSWSDENEIRNDIVMLKEELGKLSEKLETMHKDILDQLKEVLTKDKSE